MYIVRYVRTVLYRSYLYNYVHTYTYTYLSKYDTLLLLYMCPNYDSYIRISIFSIVRIYQAVPNSFRVSMGYTNLIMYVHTYVAFVFLVWHLLSLTCPAKEDTEIYGNIITS